MNEPPGPSYESRYLNERASLEFHGVALQHTHAVSYHACAIDVEVENTGERTWWLSCY